MQNFELGSFWDQVLKESKTKLPKPLWESTISSWFIPISLDNYSIHLGVIQEYQLNIMDKNPLIRSALEESINIVYGTPLNLVIININDPGSNDAESTNEINTDSAPPVMPNLIAPVLPPQMVQETTNPQIVETTNRPVPKQNEPLNKEGSFYIPTYKEPVVIDKNYTNTINTDTQHLVENSIEISNASIEDKEDFQLPPNVNLSYSKLNKSYKFDNYVTGNSNRIPFGASQAVAENPGTIYNPLFIYGSSGLGKTHLMHAIGNYIQDTRPELKVMCITSENFMNAFVELAVRYRKGNVFRNIFRNIDVLLIDDIQFLENKEGTKNEFFNTFNELFDGEKQIVLTSDTLPSDMTQLEDRLKSRFQAGFVATMETPDLETRIAILRSLIAKEIEKSPTLRVENNAINFIALQFSENIRVLQGAIKRLIGFASVDNRLQSIDLDYTKQVLSEILTTKEVTIITVESIQDFISSYFNIKKTDLLGKKRKAQFTFPRQIAMYLCRIIINESYPQIATAFNRDHTTILHAHDKISAEIEKNPETKRIIEDIKVKLNTCG